MLSVAASPSTLKRRSAVDAAPPSSAPRKRQRTLQYECDWADCQAAFHSAARLEEHRRSHTGEKPFKCTHPGCTSAFSRSHHLSAHQRVHASSSSTPRAVSEVGTASASASPAPTERKHACSAQACPARFTEGWRRKRHEETCDVLRAERGLLGQETEAEATAFASEGVGEGEATGTAPGETRKRKRGGHHERGERMYACGEAQCDASFRKRKHLRAHIWAAHSTQPELSPFVRSAAGTPAPGAAAADTGAASAIASTSALPMAPPTATVAVAKPFPCTHEGCTRSFTTAALRRTHARKHTTQRYVCTLPHAADASSMSFGTWSALQQHMKTAHPPTCAQCGKTFKRSENLRAHVARHEERAAAQQAALRRALTAGGEEGEEQGIEVEGDASMDEEEQAQLEGRRFVCNWTATSEEAAACTKRFKSAYARDTHVKVAHKKERNYKCACGKAYGHKHLLRAHVRKAGQGHAEAAQVAAAAAAAASDDDAEEEEEDEEEDAATPVEAGSDSDDFFRAEGGAVPESHASRPAAPVRRRNAKPSVSLAALLTGAGYVPTSSDAALPLQQGDASAASKRRVRGRVLSCPWAKICALRDALPADGSASFDIDEDSDEDGIAGPTKARCDYRFSRLYDVRRHLASAHDLELSDAEIKALLPSTETKGLPKSRRSTTPAARS